MFGSAFNALTSAEKGAAKTKLTSRGSDASCFYRPFSIDQMHVAVQNIDNTVAKSPTRPTEFRKKVETRRGGTWTAAPVGDLLRRLR
jgi:hypothetical protein